MDGRVVEEVTGSPAIECEWFKRAGRTVYELSIDHYSATRHVFDDYKDLYEKVKSLIPGFRRPPERRWRLFSCFTRTAASKPPLAEQRQEWIQYFAAELIAFHRSNTAVQAFFELDENGRPIKPDSCVLEKKRRAIDVLDFSVRRVVGKGTFGQVLLATQRSRELVRAIKVINKETIKEEEEVPHILSELNVLRMSDHPFLVRFHFAFQTASHLYFVLDFVNGGEVYFLMQKGHRFGEKRAVFYSACIASALGYLHERGVIYRDLKPENLVMDRLGYVVLTDFGLCKEGMWRGDKTRTLCGTPEYASPEMVRGEPYDFGIDWWALGCILFEMINGWDMDKPLLEQAEDQIRFRYVCSIECKHFVESLLQLNPDRRIGRLRDFAEIREHPVYRNVDWVKLEKRQLPPPFTPTVADDEDATNFDSCYADPGEIPSVKKDDVIIDDEFPDFDWMPPMEEKIRA